MQDTQIIGVQRSHGGWAPNLVVMFPDQETRAPDANIDTTGFIPSGHTLLATYVHTFDQVFIPYSGPDEPLGFEPEDLPIS